jgi:hypothetical protein
MANPEEIYQLKVTLDHISPPIWRRIQVSDKTTLFELHKIIQIIMGWLGYHLHEFQINNEYYTDMATVEEWDNENNDEFAFSLKSLNLMAGTKFKYKYDFGDDWSHTILLEEKLPRQKGVRYPICIKGKNACPPEDVGGPWIYKNFLEAIKDTNHPEHKLYLEWLGSEFDPSEFDLDEVNQQLFDYAYRNWPLDVEFPYKYWVPQDPMLDFQRLEVYFKKPDSDFDKELPLVKNASSFLNYLKENKVTGTIAKGNLPRKAIIGIAARFVGLQEDPEDPISNIQNEDDMPEIYFIHVILQGAGLIIGGRSLQWQLTASGEAFLSSTIERQWLILFDAWWLRVNWIVTAIFNVFGTLLPDNFTNSVSEILKKMKSGSTMDYDQFILDLAQMNQIDSAIEQDFELKFFVKSDVENMIMEPLLKFGLISLNSVDDHDFPFPVMKLLSFTMTDFGSEVFNNMIINRSGIY